MGSHSRPDQVFEALEQALVSGAPADVVRPLLEERVRAPIGDSVYRHHCMASHPDHVRLLQEYYPGGISKKKKLCHQFGPPSETTILAHHINRVRVHQAYLPDKLEVIRALLEEGLLQYARSGEGDPTGGALIKHSDTNNSLLKHCIHSVSTFYEKESEWKEMLWSILELLVQAVACARRGGLIPLFEKKAAEIPGTHSKALVDDNFMALHRDEIFADVFSSDFNFLKEFIECINTDGEDIMVRAVERYSHQVRTVDANGNLPLHCAAMKKSPGLVVQKLVNRHPEAAAVRNNQGRLPLHILAVSGAWTVGKKMRETVEALEREDIHHGLVKAWKDLNPDPLGALLLSHPEAIAIPDPETGLYPFMVAAMENHTDVAFRLLLEKPDFCNLG